MPKKNSFLKRTFSRSRYMVLDSEGLPVHTGRDLTKTEALKIAKEARAEGERRVRLVKSNPASAASLPRNKWISGHVMVTSSGQIKAKLLRSTVHQRKHKRKRK